MPIKNSLTVCVIANGVFGAAPITASVQHHGANSAGAEEVPEGLIVVKMLPPLQTESSEKSTTPRRITDRRDPEYVRWRLEPVAGSDLKKRKICMTNREWTLVIRRGNQYAREFVDDNQPGSMLQ